MQLTEFKEAALVLRGMATKLPPAERERLAALESHLRVILEMHGDLAKFAFSLIGAELAAELA